MKAVAFLQNAWSPYYARLGKPWPRASWLKALACSRSGQRLRVLEEAAVGVEFWYDNTTPIVGATPDSVIEPDYRHMVKVLETQVPDVIVCLGKQAAKAIKQLIGDGNVYRILVLPHPACRVVTNKLYQKAGKMLAGGLSALYDGCNYVELALERK